MYTENTSEACLLHTPIFAGLPVPVRVSCLHCGCKSRSTIKSSPTSKVEVNNIINFQRRCFKVKVNVEQRTLRHIDHHAQKTSIPALTDTDEECVRSWRLHTEASQDEGRENKQKLEKPLSTSCILTRTRLVLCPTFCEHNDTR